jgi:hypothetical protein
MESDGPTFFDFDRLPVDILKDNIDNLKTILVLGSGEYASNSNGWTTVFDPEKYLMVIKCMQHFPIITHYDILIYEDVFNLCHITINIVNERLEKFRSQTVLLESFDLGIIYRLEDKFGISIMDKLDI